MKTNLFTDVSLTEEEIIDNLKSISDQVETNHHFLRPYTLDEVKEKRESITNITMLIDEEENKLRAIVKEKRSSIMQKKAELKTIMKSVRDQAEEVIETVYLIADQEEGVMGYYDKSGTLISTRKLMPSERNLRIGFKAVNE